MSGKGNCISEVAASPLSRNLFKRRTKLTKSLNQLYNKDIYPIFVSHLLSPLAFCLLPSLLLYFPQKSNGGRGNGEFGGGGGGRKPLQ